MSIHIPKGVRPHAVRPRGIRLSGVALEIEKGDAPLFSIRRVVRLVTADRASRNKFARFLALSGARAVNLERADKRIDLPANDGLLWHDEDDGRTIPATRQQAHEGIYPYSTWFAVDGSPEALADLVSRPWCLAARFDVPLALPRQGSGQSPKK